MFFCSADYQEYLGLMRHYCQEAGVEAGASVGLGSLSSGGRESGARKEDGDAHANRATVRFGRVSSKARKEDGSSTAKEKTRTENIELDILSPDFLSPDFKHNRWFAMASRHDMRIALCVILRF